MEQTLIKLSAVINTLDLIEVHGAKNLDALLGCIQTLQQIQNELTAGEGEDNA